ncbi:MAG: response regulator, partial [Halothece sp. Uz-M2-17]|nr:response regulator [Halothece sp. Uz-M2-17]
LNASSNQLIPAIQSFCEECVLLAETLSLDWLQADIQPLQTALKEDQENLSSIAETTLNTLQDHRQQCLNGEVVSTESESIPTETPSPETIETPEATPATAPADPGLSLKMPVTRLDRMSNTFGELIINYERLNLISQQLQEANRSLHKHSFQLSPIKEQVQTFYDQLATNLNYFNQTPSNNEFDPLQLDQYSHFHQTLQDFQELMVRVQENRADIDIIARDFQDTLEDLRNFLDTLRTDITNSRLIPFKTYAQRFNVPLQNLNERYHKSVQLLLEGEETLVDQVILEQLQTPLTHLFRNAFDHGIETTEERITVDKSPIATIKFQARLQGNRILIDISDDGRGISLENVFAKAKAQGLTERERPQELTRDHILEFLFLPNFSTAKTVSDLSGRGVGLDVVRMQVERLNGTVSVDSTVGQGTTFTLSIPLTLSILPFLLCRAQKQTLAIPASKILAVVSLKEMSENQTLIWHQQRLPVYPLLQLLPYPDPIPPSGQEPIGLVLNINETLIVVGIDGLQGERELVVKPFDRTIPVPPYVAGCTVLGTGEVVPVVDPDYWGDLLSSVQSPTLSSNTTHQTDKDPTILVIDDSVAVRRNLESLLTKSGYDVISCRDGKEATATLDEPGKEINVVISDIEMPRLDGFGVLQAIRSHSRWHSLPVIMLTSREHERHRQKAFSLGATDYIGKPFSPQKLLATVQQYALETVKQ